MIEKRSTRNILRWKKSDRGSSHVRHGLDPRLVRNRVYSVQTHALFQNLHAKYSIFNKIFNFSSHLKFFWVCYSFGYFIHTYVVYKITNKQLVTK